jgi:hypothetical protein
VNSTVRPGANRVARKGWLGASYPPAQYANLYSIFCPLRQRKTESEEELFVSKFKGRKCRMPKKIRPGPSAPIVRA